MIEQMVTLFLLMPFSRMVSMVLRRVGLIISNGYGISGQNFVALPQGSEMSLGLFCKNLTLGI